MSGNTENVENSGDAGPAPHSHFPYGTDGSGFYADNTMGCYNVVEMATPTILSALDKARLNAGSTFTICDYGTADGGISMPILMKCVEKLKEKYGSEQQVQIIYEDQPVNDFKSLFLRLQGLIPGPPSYLDKFDGVFVSACGTGFYSQCVPNNSVQLALSTTAMHWLSSGPCQLTGALHHALSSNKEEVAKFSNQAEKNWNDLMLLRARELSPGGHMVIVVFCVDAEGQYLGNTKLIKNSMYQTMTDCLQEMITEGAITQEEFNKMTFNNYYRNVEEYSKPFNDPDSPVSKAGLRLVSIETKVVPCIYHKKWMEEGKKGDAEAARKHAKWFIPTTRTWSNSTFKSGLSENRSEEERTALVDDMFRRYEDRVAAAPEDHGMDYVHAYIQIEKVE